MNFQRGIVSMRWYMLNLLMREIPSRRRLKVPSRLMNRPPKLLALLPKPVSLLVFSFGFIFFNTDIRQEVYPYD